MSSSEHTIDDVSAVKFKLLLSCHKVLSPSQVSVDFRKAYDRISHPEVELEKSIAEYAGFNMHMEGSDSDQVSRVTVHLGLTDYSLLGNGAIVETADNKIIILRRSNNVGGFPGHYVFPGGHPEPEEVEISSHPPYESSVEFETNRKFADEMLDSIIREVMEEIGVPAMSLFELTNLASKMPSWWLCPVSVDVRI